MRHSATVLILPVLKITEFSRSVMGELHIIWARNSNGNHGPLSFIPDLFIPRDDGVNLDQLRL